MVRDSTFAGDVLSEILKLGVLLNLEEMFGTNEVNVHELWITGGMVSAANVQASDAGSNPEGGFNLNTK